MHLYSRGAFPRAHAHLMCKRSRTGSLVSHMCGRSGTDCSTASWTHRNSAGSPDSAEWCSAKCSAREERALQIRPGGVHEQIAAAQLTPTSAEGAHTWRAAQPGACRARPPHQLQASQRQMPQPLVAAPYPRPRSSSRWFRERSRASLCSSGRGPSRRALGCFSSYSWSYVGTQ